MIHVATTGSISTAARGVDIQGAVINTRVAWVTAATGILVYWYTGIQSTQRVITSTLYFVYCHNLSITLPLINLFIDSVTA